MYSADCSLTDCSGRSCTPAEVTSYHPRVPFSRAVATLLWSLWVLVPARAHAQDVAAEVAPEPVTEEVAAERPRVAHGRVGVVLLPRGEASPDMADSLTELLIAQIASRGATQIVGKEEFQAALGRDDAGTLACIESDACLGRMGRELGVEELVAGTVHLERAAAGEERFRFELYRLDVENGAALGRVAREVDDGLSALLAALTSSVDELYVERVEPGAIVVSTTPAGATLSLDDEPLAAGQDGSFRHGFLIPGSHRLSARAAGHEPFARDVEIEPGTTLMLSIELVPRTEALSISAPTMILAGVGAAILGTAVGIGAVSQGQPDHVLDMRQSQSFFAARELEANAANVLYAVGGASLVAALVSLVLDVTATDPGGDAAARAMRGEVAQW
jgi:hypothetical protein